MTRCLLVVLGLCGLSQVAAAEVHSSRFHLVTKALARKLSPVAQQVLPAVGQLVQQRLWRSGDKGYGTAFMISRKGDRALLLTNWHVMVNRDLGRAGVLFQTEGADGPRHRASIARLLAANHALDYALLEVRLPKALAEVRPLKLSSERLHKKLPIYTVGYPRLGTLKEWTLSLRQGKRQLPKPQGQDKAITVGVISDPEVREASGSFNSDWLTVAEYRFRPISVDIPRAKGSSGSPMISRETHAVVALHASGNKPYLEGKRVHWPGSAIPITLIAKELGALADGKQLPADVRELVLQLVHSY